MSVSATDEGSVGSAGESGEIVLAARRTTLVLGSKRTQPPISHDNSQALPHAAHPSTFLTASPSWSPSVPPTSPPHLALLAPSSDDAASTDTHSQTSLPSSAPTPPPAVLASANELELRTRIRELEEELARFQSDTFDLLAKAKKRIEDLFIDRQELISSARQQASIYRQQTNEQIATLTREREQLQQHLARETASAKSLAAQNSALQEQLHSLTKESDIKQGLMEHSCERISTVLEPLALAKLVMGNLSVATLSQTAAISGYLTKQGAVRKNWKKRYHILIHNFLLYYRTGSDAEPLGALYLIHPIVEHLPHTNQSRPNTVRVTSNNRTYNFSCETRDDAEKWVVQLESASSWYFSPD